MSSQQTLPFAPSTSSQQASTSAVPAKTVKKPRTSKAKEEFDPTAGIYDDCNMIRRKIRAHLAEGNKVTQFLKDIGGVNSNSYGRFMKAKGANAGQENGTYSGAYYFFEKKRIAEGKPKSKGRLANEAAWIQGHDTGRESRGLWVCAR